MRIQIEVSPEVKSAATAQAFRLGYPSLATMLRVITNGLARDYQATAPTSELTTPESTAATKAATPPTTNPPPPEQFKHWPEHIGPNIAQTDPDLYRLLIEIGQVY